MSLLVVLIYSIPMTAFADIEGQQSDNGSVVSEPVDVTDEGKDDTAIDNDAAEPEPVVDNEEADADTDEDADTEDVSSDDVNGSDAADSDFNYSGSLGGISVEISAASGVLPEGTTVSLAPLNNSQLDAVNSDAVDNIIGLDITFKDAEGNTYSEAYAAGAFDPDAQWEIDKALIAEGQEPTTLYKKVSDAEYQPVSHVLRPWETTETKYTIGIAAAQDLYLLDNVKGTSGRYWKGIFTEPRIWDGIDLSKFKVARTAIGPCPMTTVVEGGVTKSRCFFYLYEAADSDCKSDPGLIPNNPFYNKYRHYPRIADVEQVSNMNWGRANNADPTKSYPFAEGGWWATNAHIIALELLAETRYLHQANLFGSGISSNDGTNATNFYTSVGARLRVKGAEAWLYKTFGDWCDPYYYKAPTWATSMSNLLNQMRPKEAAMESQLAASMATELGIAPTESADALNTFKFYGDTYYYMNVPGFAGLQDGDMNVKVYKVQTADVKGFSEAGEATFEFEFVFRMSLFNGANLSGDIWAYNGGGLEMVGTKETDSGFGHHVDVYLQPDQKQWHHDSTARKSIGETWDFEKTYLKVGEYETLGDSYTLERMSNSPVRIKKASNMSQGENYYMGDKFYWTNPGYRARMMALLRGISNDDDCSARKLNAEDYIMYTHVQRGGSFQALIDPQA